MTTQILTSTPGDDIELVSQSLAGNRSAFGRIVERYQSLICALAFSATGNVSRSEDLAQETFVTAWQRLRDLREPAKLRSWLCGIARNNIHTEFRRQGREPAHEAAPLDAANDLASAEPPPLAQVISNEEVALLWREVGQLPEIYREPLILFYREHQSVARVAEALELSEDAVMQRLSRGRRQLHERMLAFVENALEHTNPGTQFAIGVQAALPALVAGSQATAAATVAKGAAAKGGGSLIAGMMAPLVGLFASAGLSVNWIRKASGGPERRFAVTWTLILWFTVAALVLALRGSESMGGRLHWDAQTSMAVSVGIWYCYVMILGALMVLLFRRTSAASRHDTVIGAAEAPVPLRFHAVRVVGICLAASAMPSRLAWSTGDRSMAWVLIGAAAVLTLWHLRRLIGLNRAAAGRLDMVYFALLAGMIFALMNLRLDSWLAPIYHVSPEAMQRLLPMGIVHLLTALLIGWVAALLALTKPQEGHA